MTPHTPPHTGGNIAFVDSIANRLAALHAVDAVTLGGSRARGNERPESDWDFGIYYRGAFDPQDLRNVGWPGQVFEIGGWGGGVFNGGAWLQIEGHKVDVHYRDLAVVEAEIDEANAGRFHIEPLLFHLAGIPSYLVVGELALNRVLRGDLPRPDYPQELRKRAPRIWWERAELLFAYCETNHARLGFAHCMGLVVQASTCAGHAILAGRGIWILNEKGLLEEAGLDQIDTIVDEATPDPQSSLQGVESARQLCARAVRAAAPASDPTQGAISRRR